MSKDREDREGQDEELEPLDKFFAPIEDVDWPEEPAGERGAERPSDEPAGPPEAPPEDDVDAGPPTQEMSALDKAEAEAEHDEATAQEDEWGDIRSKLRGEEEQPQEAGAGEPVGGPGTMR